MTEALPTFSVHEHMVTYENPKSITDGIVLYKEATIEIDTRTMRSDFLQRLMYHMGEGHIRVKVARMKEQQHG
ncbi:hypothetical protein UFOVP123_51 [uncultured Caudovirales phage]|uniref:Uncharacterized protein n=1 Tax=uncultured Caudovirales phage TaxID=2100421 RepID=A0A6J5LCC1_9CAUD|nr:hypothetical protein UFOVP123_51 [uncultured Caudovirales phage]